MTTTIVCDNHVTLVQPESFDQQSQSLYPAYSPVERVSLAAFPLLFTLLHANS